MGAAEAGFFPGVIVYLSHWFTSNDRAKATSNFMSAIPLSFVIGSPVAGWILGHSFLAISGWRWLFLLEGLPAVLLGSVAFFYLTDLPEQAKWLVPEQKQWLQSNLQAEKSETVQAISIVQALGSRTIVLLASVCFLNYFGYYSFLFYLPTMLKRLSGYFGPERWPFRRTALCRTVRRHAVQRVAFRQIRANAAGTAPCPA